MFAVAAAAAAIRAPSGARSGCETAAVAGSTTLELEVGGHARTVLLHVPSGYTGKHAVPLVLNLHGSGSTAGQQEAFTGMDETSDAHGFLLAYPQASIPAGAGFDWNVPGVPLVNGRPVPAGSANDVVFLTDLARLLERRYCVDAKEVYVVGFSGGARLASRLACEASGVFAAVAAVSGLRAPAPCPAKRAVPILAFHGTADPIDPYSGHGQPYWTYSVATAARDWARRERCGKAATSHPAETVTLVRDTGCRNGSTVELYTITGEGHEWPGGPHLPVRYTVLLGPQSDAIDADQLIWRFFTAHRLR